MPRTLMLIHAQPASIKRARLALAFGLDREIVVESANTCAEGLGRILTLTASQVCAIVLGLDLPDRPGLAAFESFREAAPRCPLLIVGGLQQEETAKLAVMRGAEDYILEDDLENYRLPKAVRNMLERFAQANASSDLRGPAALMLNAIGDGVISVDALGHVAFLNPMAELLTGWVGNEAIGRPVDEVMRIIDGTRQKKILSPLNVVIQEDRAAKLPPGCRLTRRDGAEFGIEDSVSPIHDNEGRVTGAVMVFHDVTHAQAISQKMLHQIQHDQLTDLPNRVLFNDRLSQAMIATARSHEKLAVLFIDLDGFKQVNDSLGHAMGDALLASVAARLVACVRRSDTVSRQGGDEFVVLLASIAHDKDAGITAQKLINAVAKPHLLAERSVQITLSAGISIFPDDSTNADTLLKNADVALLHAKDSGRNTFQFFKSSMNKRAIERQSLESSLRHALDRREFELYYQPRVDLLTEQLTGAEALIRWGRPNGDLASPSHFIPVAEQCGVIVPIGRWLLREACRQSCAWHDARGAQLPVAVNVSAVELRADGFVEHVRAILHETGASPEHLEFELTEAALMNDPQMTVAVLRELRDIGIRIAVDDFGTGLSSLNYLRRFPLDALKIDQSFVHGVCSNPEDAKVVSAVISLGLSFNLRVIAEGIETRAQFFALRSLDCAEGQGHYFRAPIAARVFTQLLRSDLSTTDMTPIS